MRPMSTAIQFCMSPLQFQQAMPHLGAPPTMACPGHRYPQPAGRTKPCWATHWRALAQRSSAVKFPGRATGAGVVVGGAVAGVVAGATGRGLAVVVTGLGLTVVDVDVDVDVVVDDVVLDVVDGGTVVSGAGAGGAEADASAVDHATMAPATASTASKAATL